MTRTIRPATGRTVPQITDALAHLRDARNLLTAADCHQAVQKVRRAMKSTEGALRHAFHRAQRQEATP